MRKQTEIPPFTWDRHTLYELCAQNPPRDARLLTTILDSRKANPTLAEDFSGTAALSRAWCTLHPRARAIATDIHAPTLARARELLDDVPPPSGSSGRWCRPVQNRIRFHCADVRRVSHTSDLIAVLNFSICELHTRKDLLAYLRRARRRLHPRGVLICDIYGGPEAFQTSTTRQRITPPQFLQNPGGNAGANATIRLRHPARRDTITYTWEQRDANPLTARVINAMHFRVARHSVPGRGRSGLRLPRTIHFPNAFIYHWRLWSIPELTEAMHEAGFRSIQIYPRAAAATDSEGNLYTRPITDPADLDENYNLLIAAR